MHLEKGDYFSYESLVDNFIGRITEIGEDTTTYYEISVPTYTAEKKTIGNQWLRYAHKISKKQ